MTIEQIKDLLANPEIRQDEQKTNRLLEKLEELVKHIKEDHEET